MKSVLISIRPKWVEKIASGQKTIEVRRSAPKEVPFKAYIYCTNGEYSPTNCGKKSISDCLILNRNVVNGKVIGEFICDKVDGRLSGWDTAFGDIVDTTPMCLTVEELLHYSARKPLYFWHISDLKIYDKPKEVSEFYIRKFDNNDYCSGCIHHETPITEYPCNDCRRDAFERKYLTRPPQSWQYIEDLGEEE